MIKGLDSKVDVVFSPDVNEFGLTVPYNKKFYDCMGWGWMEKKKVIKDGRTWWVFKSESYGDCMKIVYDFFGIDDRNPYVEDSVSNTDNHSVCHSAGIPVE